MKKYLIAILIIQTLFLGGIWLRVSPSSPMGGPSSRTTRISTTATSGPMTITSDVQLLSTTTNRTFAEVVNDCSSVVYLTTSGDEQASQATGFRLNANGGSWNTDTGNVFIYTGAVRASSTDETSCLLNVKEY